VKLRYTRRAAAELDEVLSYIDQRSPQGAQGVKTRIHQMLALLLQHPLATLRAKAIFAAWWSVHIPT
jgi:plasmid stabilization system protein ParE